MTVRRDPAAAGRFYAGTEDELRSQIEKCFTDRHGPGEVPEVEEGADDLIGLISPHAGYPYSGPIAAHGYSYLAESGKPERIVILGPNHTGRGGGVAMDPSDYWTTPLGDVKVDRSFAEKILNRSDLVEFDPDAHQGEHSIEVQLPFFQFLFSGEFKILPISIGRQTVEVSENLGGVLGELVDEGTLIIASSDFTHYEPMKPAKRKDKKAVERIEDMDWRGFLDLVSKEDLSICGYSPIAILMVAAGKIGVEETRLFKYATSGDTAGSPGRVVGYCSLGFLE